MTDEAPKKNKGGGKRPGAGRPKGRRNTFTEAMKKRALDRGLSSLDVMTDMLNWNYRRWKAETVKVDKAEAANEKPDEEALLAKHKATMDVVKELAPYMHPKLAAVQHTGKGGGPIQTVDLTKFSNDDLDRLEAILGAVADTGGDPSGEGTPEG